MIERVVEDWLTSVSERNFEVPFAQLLALKGYRVIHIANPHGPQEQGKDIIAIDPHGRPVAFQMKAHPLMTLENWRDPKQPLKGQVEDLLDTQIRHPGVRSKRLHMAILVTTGRLDNTLSDTIDAFNSARAGKRRSRLEVWTRDDLQKMVIDCLSRFVPGGNELTREFMRLYLEDGRALPDKKRIASFFERVVGFSKVKMTVPQVRQSCAEVVLLATHLAASYQNQKNHIGEIEVWTLAGASLLRTAACHPKVRRTAEESFRFAETSIWQTLCRLREEVDGRKNLAEGDPTTDWMVFGTRVTYLASYLGLGVLWARGLHASNEFDESTHRFLRDYGGQRKLWGEGAVPFFLCTGWAEELLGDVRAQEGLCIQMARLILTANRRERRRSPPSDMAKPRSPALFSPYVLAEKALMMSIETSEEAEGSRCSGQSYALEPVLKILVNRNLRQHVAALWEDVTRLALATYIPAKAADLWRFENGHVGTVETRYVPQPASWKSLREECAAPDQRLLPSMAVQHPLFLMLYMLVAPHRLNASVALFLDQQEWGGEVIK